MVKIAKKLNKTAKKMEKIWANLSDLWCIYIKRAFTNTWGMSFENLCSVNHFNNLPRVAAKAPKPQRSQGPKNQQHKEYLTVHKYLKSRVTNSGHFRQSGCFSRPLVRIF